MSNEFSFISTSIASGAPEIPWEFKGHVGGARIRGALARVELRADGSADLRITAEDNKVLADLIVHRLNTDESITVSVTNVGSALLWSHVAWLDASNPVSDAGLPIEVGGDESLTA